MEYLTSTVSCKSFINLSFSDNSLISNSWFFFIYSKLFVLLLSLNMVEYSLSIFIINYDYY